MRHSRGKLNAMNTQVKSHTKGQGYLGYHFFVLNKGLNSGKPLLSECPNSFVMRFENQKDCDACYWLAYSLWKIKFWHSRLVGSVIPFLRINDFKSEFDKKYREIQQQYDGNKKCIDALQQIEKREANFRKNLALLADMRHAILYRYIGNK